MFLRASSIRSRDWLGIFGVRPGGLAQSEAYAQLDARTVPAPKVFAENGMCGRP